MKSNNNRTNQAIERVVSLNSDEMLQFCSSNTACKPLSDARLRNSLGSKALLPQYPSQHAKTPRTEKHLLCACPLGFRSRKRISVWLVLWAPSDSVLCKGLSTSLLANTTFIMKCDRRPDLELVLGWQREYAVLETLVSALCCTILFCSVKNGHDRNSKRVHLRYQHDLLLCA